MSESFSLLCTTRFDPCLEAFEWNNAPDGSPSPYLLLAHQLDRLVSSAHLCRWTVSDSLDYKALKNVCDETVRRINGADGKTPLKVIRTLVLCQALTRTRYASSSRRLGISPHPLPQSCHCVMIRQQDLSLILMWTPIFNLIRYSQFVLTRSRPLALSS